jgi:hypothetical protein
VDCTAAVTSVEMTGRLQRYHEELGPRQAIAPPRLHARHPCMRQLVQMHYGQKSRLRANWDSKVAAGHATARIADACERER